MSEEKTLMEEVDAALADTLTSEPTPAPEEDNNADDVTLPEGDDTDGAADSEESDDAETDETGDSEGDSEGEPEKGPNGERERNPDGTWKKSEEKKPEPKAKDPINDPIPENTKK